MFKNNLEIKYKLLNILYLIMVLCFCYCKSQDKNGETVQKSTNATEGIAGPHLLNSADYDSVKYFKDADWATFAGVNELKKGQLSYPFVEYGYKKEYIDITVFFEEKKVKKWQLTNYKNHWCYLTRGYDREYRDTINVLRIFISNNSSIQLLCLDKPFENEILNPVTITIWESHNFQTLTQTIYMGYRNKNNSFTLSDALLPDQEKIEKRYAECIYSKKLIRDNKIFRTYELYKKNDRSIRMEDKKEVIENDHFMYDSFFMFYSAQK